MILHDTYATKSHSVDELKELVEPLIGVAFQGRESEMLGGDYWFGRGPGDETIRILVNHLDPTDPEEWMDTDLQEYAVVMRVETTRRGDLILSLVSSIDGVMLRRRTPPQIPQSWE